MEPHAPDATVDLDQPLHAQFEGFLDEYRAAINACLDGLSEEQARRSLVASKTTLLGLVKHATFVEQVWFDQAVTCRTRVDLGIPETADDSFDLDDGDTITSVQEGISRPARLPAEPWPPWRWTILCTGIDVAHSACAGSTCTS